MFYGCYRDNQIKIMPTSFDILCSCWVDPDDGTTISGLYDASPQFLESLGIYPADVICPDFDDRYEQIADGEWEFNADEMRFKRYNIKQDKDLETVRADRLDAVREQCRSFIYTVIGQEHQLDVALGIMPDLGYTSWIASMIQESNRCEDLYSSATSIDDLKAVVWNFPEYVYP